MTMACGHCGRYHEGPCRTIYEVEHVTAALSEKPSLSVPTIHLNGTSKESLVRDLCAAHHALTEAGRKLAATCPNGRDYYVQDNPEAAIHKAMREHEARMAKLREVAHEIEQIAEAIGD